MMFSVIIPIYKVEQYLCQCVDSVLAQSYEDYELILVDDGSPDNSGKICDEYQSKYPRVKVIHKPNGGLSDARNFGTSAAEGDYIVYIDSDDYVSDINFLDDLKNQIEEKKSDLILYKFQKFTDGEESLQPCGFSMRGIDSMCDSDEILLSLVQADAYYGSAWIKAIKRTVLIDNDIDFEKGLLGEDMEWSCNLLTKAETVSAIDKPYIAYRQRAGSISKTNKLKNLTDFIYILEKWSVGIESAQISETRRLALRGSLAKYYANLLITYIRVKDSAKKQYKKRLKALHHLLKYSMSKRPKMIKKMYGICGFGGTVTVLKILDKVKG